jgi:hypothetical protein
MNNEMDVDKQAEILKELGLSDISEDAVVSTKRMLEYRSLEVVEASELIAVLLMYSARGDYDYATGVWTPISSHVYSFDVEVFDIENMYSLFFQGIMSINNSEFAISNVVEDMSGVNQETGQGERKVSFLYNGLTQLFIANGNFDWFDVKVIDFVNDILAQNGNQKKLYGFSDGYQECIIFYCTEEWAREFTAKTGCVLAPSTN